MKQHLRLHAHVEFVSGSQHGALYDLQGGRVRTVPLVLQTIIQAFLRHSVEEVLQECFNGNEAIFQRYTDFLVKGNWAFLTAKPERFPTANRSWDSPYPINTGVVAHDFLSPYDLPAALRELSDIGCRHLELQLYNYPTVESNKEAWEIISKTLKKCEFRRGTLVLGGEQTAVKGLSPDGLENYFVKWPRFGTMVVLGQDEDRNLTIGKRKYYLRKVDQLTDYAKKTWKFRPDTHFVGPAYFREARIANPYFNRRLAIDRWGNFKNDLIHGGQDSFGKIGQRTINNVLKDPQFLERWFAGPDAIVETSDNPFRYCLRYDRAICRDDAAKGWSFSAA